MKRLHVHVSVNDIEHSVRFYSTLFAAAPTVLKGDYAKWMLEDPRVNFAISARDGTPGVQHLGLQVEDASELAEVYGRLSRAGRPVVEQSGIACCYAKSDKQWIADPQGVAWEAFLTHGETTVHGESDSLAQLKVASGAPCCEPSDLAAAAAEKSSRGCCAA
jgi:hypothetical protein